MRIGPVQFQPDKPGIPPQERRQNNCVEHWRFRSHSAHRTSKRRITGFVKRMRKWVDRESHLTDQARQIPRVV